MILKFKTKINRNGNSNFLRIDTAKHCYYRSCNEFSSCDYVIISKTDLYKLIETIKENGYKEHIVI